MLMVVSPAKTLDYESPVITEKHTIPGLLEHSELLIEVCRQLTPADIASLMKVSDKIAGLNVARFAQWRPDFSHENARQAIFAFKGDVYTGFDAYTMNDDAVEFTQSHLRILSGLYGILKPLDLMQPYRLEMGTRLANSRGNNLYQFWGDIITEQLNQDLQTQKNQVLVNLASNEYFKAVNPEKIAGQVITPVFKDQKNGQYKIISFYAKKARGLMARYVVDNQIDSPDKLKEFDVAGYYFVEAESTATELVFKRDASDA
ncbi:hypothetical protein VA7868_00802 [Vibrio aerogenes CECT 7868]|uniref:UPF0246 protein VA7868_00802 n=1 Tax=Vibrio aerogenes CECT 7868 TaxID=1216006 RepID=A0A1M5WN71_9VIBR|nr:peroxide stress protein YaaA [Vibrio aerogenes]SHH89030.1 hypothetical protein VA7868_00802 [Vibrio aerogenes CECT 7868]